jgi:hypothetical protein
MAHKTDKMGQAVKTMALSSRPCSTKSAEHGFDARQYKNVPEAPFGHSVA